MIDLFMKVWICVVFGAACAFLSIAFLLNVLLGQWQSLSWAAIAICGTVYFVRRAARLHRREKQHPVVSVGRTGR